MFLLKLGLLLCGKGCLEELLQKVYLLVIYFEVSSAHPPQVRSILGCFLTPKAEAEVCSS
jgi:hypothetical protein